MYPSQTSTFRPFLLLAFIPLGIGLFRFPSFLVLLGFETFFLHFVVLVAVFVLMVYWADDINENRWGNYLLALLCAAFFSLGASATLNMLMVGTLLALVAQYTKPNQSKPPFHFVENFLGRIGITGNALLLAVFAFYALGGEVPLKAVSHLSVFIPISAFNFVVWSMTYLMGRMILGKTHQETFKILRTNALTDALLITVGTAYAPIVDGVGLGAGLVVLGLLVAMAYRYQQIHATSQILVRRMNEIETLKTLGETITTKLEFDEVLEAVHGQIERFVTANTVFVATYNEEAEVIEYPLVRRDGKPIHWQSDKLSRGLTDWVIRKRKPLLLNELQSHNYGLMGIDIAEIKSAAYMGVPLVVSDKLIGVLGVTHETRAEAFDTADFAVLQAIASQVALSIRNATLYQRTLRFANHMSLINQSLHEVLFRLEDDDALKSVCEIACEISGAQKSAIWLINKQGTPTLKSSHGLNAGDMADLPPHPLQTEGLRAISNITQVDDAFLKVLAHRDGFKACLEVPLRSGSMVLGFITVYYDVPKFYDTLTISLMETLANQVTASLDNAELLQTLELYASEQSQLVHLSRMAGADLELERVMQNAVSILKQMIGVENILCGIYESNEKDLSLYEWSSTSILQKTTHALDQFPEFSRFSVSGVGISPELYAQDSPALHPRTREWMQARQWQALGIMPMMVNKLLFGVLILGDTRPLTMTENTLRLLELATNQITPQLHNAYLYEETSSALTQQLEQLALIEDIAQNISRSLDQSTIIENVLDAAMRATQATKAQIVLQIKPNEWAVTHSNSARKTERYTTHILDNITKEVLNSVRHMMDDGSTPNEAILLSDTTEEEAWLAVPLLNKSEVLGVLRISHEVSHIFTFEHAGFIRSLAGHATMAIANASLLDNQQYQIHVLNALRALSLEALNAPSETAAWQTLIRHTMTLLDARECGLYAYDAQTDELIILSGARMIGGTFTVIEPHLIEGAIYRAARQRMPQFAHNATPHPDEEFATYYPSVIALPITRHQTVSEVLAMGFDQTRYIAPNEQQALEWLGVQLSGLLENIRLNATISDANQRMRVILDSTRDAILLLDIAGRLQDANRACSELFDLPLAEYIGLTLGRILQAKEHPLAPIAEVTPEETSEKPLELTFAREGVTRYVQAVAVPVRDGEGTHIGRLLSLRDITEDKRLEKTREELQKMIVHDLRSPAGAIFSSLSFMLMILDELDPEQTKELRQPVSISLDSVVKLLQLTDNLLDVPRMKDLQLTLQPTSIAHLATKAFDIMVYSLKEAQISIETQIEDALVSVDADIFRRVLVNLLHNALKFTPEKGTIMLATRPDPDPRFVQLIVCDTGPGIPDDMHERIFNEYEQVEKARPERGGKGTGIGLTFCKLAIERHGGRIWVMDKKEGLLKGACIAMTLPLVQEVATSS